MRKRVVVSKEPAECFVHESGYVREHDTITAKVNCTLTCDAARNLVALVATELRPVEETIIPGSARIEGDAIVAGFQTKGGNKHRVYTMTADEARELCESLRMAADYVDEHRGPKA